MRVSSCAFQVFLLVGLSSSSLSGTLAFAPAPTRRSRQYRLASQQQQQQLLRTATQPSFGRIVNHHHSVPPTNNALLKQQQQQRQAHQTFLLHAVQNDNDGDKANGSSSSSSNASLFDDYLEQIQLRQAVNYLKQHPNTPLDRSRWNRIFAAIEERTRQATENDFAQQLQQQQQDFPLESAARQEMTDMYTQLQEMKQLTLYGAIPITAPPAAGNTHSVSPDLLETILAMPMKALTPQPTNTLLLAGVVAALAEVAVSASTGIDLNTLVLSTLALSFLDRLFLNGAVLESGLKFVSPGVQDKILRHEAGHFLAAYLLGCPVEGIVLSAWGALQDKRFGSRQVSAGTSFYDPELSRQINSSAAATSGGGLGSYNSQGLTRSSIDRYSIIVMAGIAAEADCYGRADGGAGDEMALVAFLSRLNGSSRNSVPTWDGAAIKNQARWGAMQAVLMFREYKPAYEALVDALERGGTLGDCIYAIEKAARDHNLKPLQQPIGYLTEESNGSVSWRTTTATGSSVDEDSWARLEQQNEKDSVKPAMVMDREESLATLKDYRAVVEKRIEELDQQLEKLN